MTDTASPPVKPLLLTVKDVCSMLQLSRPTIYGLMQAGEIRSVRVGRIWRIPSPAVEEFVARNTGREL